MIEIKIQHLKKLANEVLQMSKDSDFLQKIENQNPWFIPPFVELSLTNIAQYFLDESALRDWLKNYSLSHRDNVGVVLAGNIPAVGFHDILCCYFGADKVFVKLSSKDSILMQTILKIWTDIDSDWKERLQIVDRIDACDKIIATGSNSSYNYFEYYFKKYKNILRRNRTAIAVINKDIRSEELDLLMDDIFLYFGLGCRNVSKLWIEKGFELSRIFEASERYNFFFQHSKYMNNYDYQRTLLLLNNVPHLSNNFLMLKEDKNIFSAISVVHYEFYKNKESILDDIEENRDNIQCVIGQDFIPFGQSQKPSLSDYADGVDTLQFLTSHD